MAARLMRIVDTDPQPRALQRLESALAWLKDAGEEGATIPLYRIGGKHSSEWGGDPGAANRRWRAMRARYLKQLERIAGDLEAEIQGDAIYRKGHGWRCPRCQRFQKQSNSFCANCGIPKQGDMP